MTWTNIWHGLAVWGLANLFLVAFLWVESRLSQPENVEETLREQVRQERLAAAPWN
jgi:heme exporter protein D